MESFWRSNSYFQNSEVLHQIFDVFLLAKVDIQSSLSYNFTLSLEKRKQGLDKIDFIIEHGFLDEKNKIEIIE